MTSPRRLGSNPLHHTTTTTKAKQQSVSQKVEGWPTLGQNDLIIFWILRVTLPQHKNFPNYAPACGDLKL